MQHGLSQRLHNALPQRWSWQTQVPRRPRRSTTPSRWPQKCGGRRTGPDKVYPDFYAHRPCSGRRAPWIRIAHASGANPARRGKFAAAKRTRMDSSCAGDIPPHDRLNVLWCTFSQHVGRLANGGCLSQWRTGNAGSHVHGWRGLSSETVAFTVFEIHHSANCQWVLRLGRDYPCLAGNEGRSLCGGNQVRPGGQARWWWFVDVVQGQQSHCGHQGCSSWGESSQSAHASDQVFDRRIRGQNDPVHVHGLGLSGAGLP